MKHIKTFEAFNINQEKPTPEIGADMNLFNNSELNIKDYNSKKSNLLNIYMNYTEDQTPSNAIPSDLYKKLVSAKFVKQGNVKGGLVFLNPLFTIYSEFCKKSREIKNLNDTLSQKKQDLQDKQKSLSTNTGDRTTANSDIESLNNDISTQTKSLNQLTQEITDLQKAANDQLKAKTADLNASKKRITKLDGNV